MRILNPRQVATIRPFSTHLTTARHEALTLHHKTDNLLEPVFRVAERPSKIQSNVETAGFWRDVLSDTFETLSIGAERPARVAVYSLDEWSGATDLVTALLDEPLNSDQSHGNILRTRWKDANPKTGLTISTQPTESSSSIRLPSSYLKQFSIPLEITELPASSSQTLPPSFFKADVPIIVFNPLTTPLSSLQHLTIPSHTIFVASFNPHFNDNTHFIDHLLSQLPQTSKTNTPHRLLFIDPSRALGAIQTFRENPTSTSAIQRYQDNFSGSGISLVTDAIRTIVDSGATTSSPDAYLRNRTAIIQLHDALNAFCLNIQTVQKSLDDIRDGTSQLTGRIEEAKVRVPHDVLGSTTQTTGGNEKDIVNESLRLASKEMKGVLERLSWWKTIWRVDEISGIVGGAVDRVWCKDLEQKLILQTGHLLSHQEQFTSSASSLVHRQTPTPTSGHSNHPLFTANVLKNSLSQLTSSPTYTLTPSTLTTPIIKRKHQLLTYPTTRLHLKAQRLLFGTTTSVAASSGFTWAGWMAYLSAAGGGVGDTIWSIVGMGMEPTTGIGVGFLGVVGSLRWAVGKWEKEKKWWWRDWERIGKGLGRDLKATVDTTMQNQVVVVADAACKGLQELCEKRQEEVDKIKSGIMELQHQLKDIDSRTQV